MLFGESRDALTLLGNALAHCKHVERQLVSMLRVQNPLQTHKHHETIPMLELHLYWHDVTPHPLDQPHPRTPHQSHVHSRF